MNDYASVHGRAKRRLAGSQDVNWGLLYPRLSRGSVMCNPDDCYRVDEDVGPLFITWAAYFPYAARVCLKGHELAKRPWANAGLACAHPQRLQQILDALDAARIETGVAQGLARRPDPFTPEDHSCTRNSPVPRGLTAPCPGVIGSRR